MAIAIKPHAIRDILSLCLLVLIMALPGLTKLPVIDRDEARYAQASVQMIETGDYVNIRFQDRARNKKPAGSYWVQTASVRLFSDVNKREIWAHRLPSVLAALIAVLATYWGGRKMIGRDAALTGAALLAISMIFVFEAHIAKTDALLCACATLVLASFAYLRNGSSGPKSGHIPALIFWAALGMSVMIKGPLLLLVVGLCLITLLIWERQARWLKPLLYIPGPLLFLLIILPWGILIWRETGGAFFTDAIGGDLGPKLKGGQERHGGLPGYYSLGVWLFFWPASLFLLPALAFCVRAVRNTERRQTKAAKSIRLLLAWSIPYWIFLEIVPTKLPHYPLPVYPALALMAGAAVIAISSLKVFPVLRRINAVIFVLISIILAAGLLFAQAYYGHYPSWSFATMGLAILLSLFAAQRLWVGKAKSAVMATIVTAMMVSLPTYQFIMPSLDDLLLSRRIKSALQTHNIPVPLPTHIQLFSPQFTEPSLVYRLGTHILLGKADERLKEIQFKLGDLIILDRERSTSPELEAILTGILANQDLCLNVLDTVKGTNYAKGDVVVLDILKTEACPPPIVDE
jgi:4-amino-4-deoxy-L-arabinose transferase-like glycosyltransferase